MFINATFNHNLPSKLACSKRRRKKKVLRLTSLSAPVVSFMALTFKCRNSVNVFFILIQGGNENDVENNCLKRNFYIVEFHEPNSIIFRGMTEMS